ncbi:MAG: CvpA family protein [Firmicutes bacterium]|nr:CvpA family protein [Bacillota bacterium]
MSIVVNIILIAFIILGTYAGFRKGLIKSLVSFIGLVAIVILSYSLRVPLAGFLIDKLPFFGFSGILEGLTSLNILLYNVIAFIVIFILLYCVLNIVLAVTGFIDTLLKFTVIWIIPSKIGGAIVGFLESWIFLYLILFVLAQFSFSAGLISDSKISDIILNNTPVVGNYLGGAQKAAKEIYEGIEKYTNDETKTTEDLNLYILQIEINYDLITSDKANELMQIGKIGLERVSISRPV